MLWFEIAAGWMLILSLAAFFVCFCDKRAAKRAGHRRVPEKTFFLLALAGGAGGLWAGMYVFRHQDAALVFCALRPAHFHRAVCASRARSDEVSDVLIESPGVALGDFYCTDIELFEDFFTKVSKKIPALRFCNSANHGNMVIGTFWKVDGFG